MRLDDLTDVRGRYLDQRISRFTDADYRARLVAAGMYTSTPERLLGTQFLSALVGVFLVLWSCGAHRWIAALILLARVAAAVLGWTMPMFIVDRARRSVASRSSAPYRT